jgi:hypothetical protein
MLSQRRVPPCPHTSIHNHLIYPIQIRVLQQLTELLMMHPEKIREKMEEQKDMDQATWVSVTHSGILMTICLNVENRE